ATEGLSHPEAFIRARALALWQQQGESAASDIASMIEGESALDELDLIGQARLAGSTRRLLEHFLQPKWFQTPAVLGHAKLFFDDFEAKSEGRSDAKGKVRSANDESPAETPPLPPSPFLLPPADPRLREYLCYVLLDFVTVDP